MRLCLIALALSAGHLPAAAPPDRVRPFLRSHCFSCHDAESKAGGLDLASLPSDALDAWIKAHDRIRSGEMPPARKPRPARADLDAALTALSASLTAADLARRKSGRSPLRRLTRAEYQNTVRDLLGLPGVALADLLPEDGRAHGFDKAASALDLSHVHLARYLEAADKALVLAVATHPRPEEPFKVRLYPGGEYGIIDRLLNGDTVALKDFKFDDSLVPLVTENVSGIHAALVGMKKLPYRGSVGILRNDNNDTFKADLARFSPIVPGQYRVRFSTWGFQWDKGKVKPGPAMQVAALVNDKRGLMGYFDAPSLKPKVHEAAFWLNPGEVIQFKAASVVQELPPHRYKGILSEFVGTGIALDWLEVEGPLTDGWPGLGHRRLFGDVPLKRFDAKAGIEPPKRFPVGQQRGNAVPEPTARHRELWTPSPADPAAAAEKLLASFLPLAFRRPATAAEARRYAGLAQQRLKEKATFEEAMLTAYQAVLCSPDFLYLRGKPGRLDDFALASRLSYFLWGAMPDAELLKLAGAGKLRQPVTLHQQVERLLDDPRAERFVADFTDQWLDLRLIEQTTPEGNLYNEYRPILRDSMVGESRAFFREMLAKDLPASSVVHTGFAILNQTMAEHYGIGGVTGHGFRKVALPAGSPRGGILTQAAILKVTANGTSTSPVRRGAWVMRKILGEPPEPPPPDVPAIEPDTRGLTTIRAILDKHRADPSCASCHKRIDPPGLALESFDVIGGFRTRYRALEKGDQAPAPPPGAAYLNFRLGLPVDPSGTLATGEKFADLAALKKLWLRDEPRLARNLAEHLIVYATGAPATFADRPAVEKILRDTAKGKHGLRSLVHAVVQSTLFTEK